MKVWVLAYGAVDGGHVVNVSATPERAQEALATEMEMLNAQEGPDSKMHWVLDSSLISAQRVRKDGKSSFAPDRLYIRAWEVLD